MESYALYHYVTVRNGRRYEFSLFPDSPFDDIDSSFLEFTQAFTQMRLNKKAQDEAKAKAEAEAAQAASAEEPAKSLGDVIQEAQS